MMLDLFDEPVLPGLRTRAGIIDPAEEAMLIERIDATHPTPFKFGQAPYHVIWLGLRLRGGTSGCS
jgi:hypothetical protein